MSNQEAFTEIQSADLATVSGGTTSSDQQLQLMLSQITSSIQQISANKNQGMDPTMMMMMMMMMGGGGGGGGVVEPGYAAAPGYPIGGVNVSTIGGGGFCGGGGGGCHGGSKKGW